MVQALAALPVLTTGTAVVPRGRRGGAAAVLVAVVLLHALVLAAWPSISDVAVRPGAAPTAVMQVRLAGTAGPAPGAAPQPQAAATPAADTDRPRAATATPAAGRAAAPARRVNTAAASPVAADVAAPPIATAATAATAAAPAADPSDADASTPPTAALDPAALALPTYRTQLPPPFTLAYQVHRPGPQRRSGPVELSWQPQADRYTLSLGSALLGSTSSGKLDDHGLAPERQADTRRTREVRAVNFQRDAGRITYSGPQVEHALLPGAQDRLSWLVQLAGILTADATLRAPGSTVRLFVTGPRGDAAVWTFTVIGPDTVDLPGSAPVPALRLLREPEGPHDTRVELWADPARHHLPVRMRLQARSAADGTEFLLAPRPTP